MKHNISPALEVTLPAFGDWSPSAPPANPWAVFMKSMGAQITARRCCVEHQRLYHLQRALARVPPALRSLPRAEFGVRDARTLRILASSSDEEVSSVWHGFDSFRGLPSPTRSPQQNTSRASHYLAVAWRAGTFSRHGALPRVPANVHLHAGWFNESLAAFMDSHEATTRGTAGAAPPAFAFVHLDADIYDSTLAVLDMVFGRCWHRRGTVLAFDELFGPMGQEEHELRALNDAARRHGVRWRYVSYTLTPSSPFARAAVQIESAAPRCPM